jgi:tetraacyldisaccharide 4'-kinase
LKRLDGYWYQRNLLSLILLPLSWFFCLMVIIRRRLYNTGILKSARMPVPVIIVGNITVGGSGKTPLVIALVHLLQKAGYSPCVISRGYGGNAESWPQQVRADSDPRMVGDEPVLISARCQVPMAVGPDRVAAAQQLLQHHDCDIIVSDDGMQHYALERDIEIAVLDGIRRMGNGYCLPAGPLREPAKRLKDVDFVIANGLAMRMEYPMELVATDIINLHNGKHRQLEELKETEVHAIAGIGNPKRFFQYLNKWGIRTHNHPFPDHFDFSSDDLVFDDDLPVVMTEKDAVKCARFAHENMWSMPVRARLDERFITRLLYTLKKLSESTDKH